MFSIRLIIGLGILSLGTGNLNNQYPLNFTPIFFSENHFDKPTTDVVLPVEKFHVLALSRIDEVAVCEVSAASNHFIRRPSNKVDNWDLIYTDSDKGGRCLEVNKCNENAAPECDGTGKGAAGGVPRAEHLPLDARKATTLRRHYYPEGGWGWVIVVCTVAVHVLNHGVQLSCTQMVLPGSKKFKVEQIHFAG